MTQNSLRKTVCLSTYHMACIQRRMDEQCINVSEVVRQMIYEAETFRGRRPPPHVHANAQKIQLAAFRLRTLLAPHLPATVLAALDTIDAASGELLDFGST